MNQSNVVQDLVTIASVNFSPVYYDAKATVEKMSANVVEAAAQGADLVVFPEGSLLGCRGCPECADLAGPCETCIGLAETVPGPSSDAMAALAREHDLYIVYGMAERDAQIPSTLYNSAAVVGPEGVIGVYRKVHLGELPWVTEGVTYTPGTALPLFPTRFGPIGVQICYDIRRQATAVRAIAISRLAVRYTPEPWSQ